jgi:hypothetical protein
MINPTKIDYIGFNSLYSHKFNWMSEDMNSQTVNESGFGFIIAKPYASTILAGREESLIENAEERLSKPVRILKGFWSFR